jgi:uncharacterized membrane protein
MEYDEQKYKKSIKEKLIILVKTYFGTGLIVIIPLWITYFIMAVIFRWVSNFAFPVINHFVVDKYWVRILAKLSSFLVSLLSIAILGFIANKVFGKSALKFIENCIKKLPILGTVHSTAKQFVNFIFGKDSKKSFKQVVFVPYPIKETYSVAFLTGEQIVKNKRYLCVFMPTTPNPTSGFLLLFKEEDIIYTDYTIEQAVQFIVSVGVIGMVVNKIEFEKEIGKMG